MDIGSGTDNPYERKGESSSNKSVCVNKVIKTIPENMKKKKKKNTAQFYVYSWSSFSLKLMIYAG